MEELTPYITEAFAKLNKGASYPEVAGEIDYLMSPKMYEHYWANPDKFNDALHERYCSGTRIDVEYPYGRESEACPLCWREFKLKHLEKRMLAAGIAESYLEHEWDTIEKDIDMHRSVCPFRKLENYADRLPEMLERNASLLIFSRNLGVGKTLSTILIAKAAIRAGYKASVVKLGKQCLKVRENYSSRRHDPDAMTESKLIEELTEPHFLVIDDLGADHATENKIEARVLAHVLEARNVHGRPTIISSNHDLNTLIHGQFDKQGNSLKGGFQGYGARTMSRLQPFAEIAINHNKDFRQEGADFNLNSEMVLPTIRLEAA